MDVIFVTIVTIVYFELAMDRQRRGYEIGLCAKPYVNFYNLEVLLVNSRGEVYYLISVAN